jgi:TRAP-type transport system periplasmic protein
MLGTAMMPRDVRFCLAFVHDPGSFHARKKIAVPADVEGLKIRPARATLADLVARLGGRNVQAAAPEVREVPGAVCCGRAHFPVGINVAVRYR